MRQRYLARKYNLNSAQVQALRKLEDMELFDRVLFRQVQLEDVVTAQLEITREAHGFRVVVIVQLIRSWTGPSLLYPTEVDARYEYHEMSGLDLYAAVRQAILQWPSLGYSI